MNNDTIKVQKIKGYVILINDIEELICKYNRLSNNDEISETTHSILYKELTALKKELIYYISSVVNE